MKRVLFVLTLLGGLSSACAQEAAQQEDDHLLLHTTYIWQKKAAFAVQPGNTFPKERSYSLNAVLHWAKRVWAGGTVYVNAEMEKSIPFRIPADVGGPSNQEDAKDFGRPNWFITRAFLQQVWGQGGEIEQLVGSENQLAGPVDVNRVVLTTGHFALVDIFGKNSYTFDPTLFFMNWSNTTYAAYDYASDAHGYTWATALEWYQPEWVSRLGLALMPRHQYGFSVDTNWLRHYSTQFELEHRHRLAGRDGKARLLLWRNRGVMGQFQDALTLRPANQAPNVAAVRLADHVKYGIGADAEQKLTDNLGVFCRLMTTDGRTETWSYLDVDDSAALGATLAGAGWGRPEDLFGVVLKRNYLSPEHRAYLQAGGVSFLGTQGAFAYGSQSIFETYYNWRLKDGVQFTLDYQRVRHPSFNVYRGPASMYGFRIHMEY